MGNALQRFNNYSVYTAQALMTLGQLFIHEFDFFDYVDVPNA